MKTCLLLTLSFVALCLPDHSTAETLAGCAKDQQRTINKALRSAKALTLKAATSIDDTAEFNRWFGPYSSANAEEVRANLKAIMVALRSGAVTAQCDEVGPDNCDDGEYAWVYPDQPYLLRLCPPFFNLPALAALEPGARRSENGTQEGTIVHEVSHFNRVARTDDYCYSRRDCTELAQRDPKTARDNADSYQYFTEDVTYYALRPSAEKPPAAPYR